LSLALPRVFLRIDFNDRIACGFAAGNGLISGCNVSIDNRA
jgi:hypothetical protein